MNLTSNNPTPRWGIKIYIYICHICIGQASSGQRQVVHVILVVVVVESFDGSCVFILRVTSCDLRRGVQMRVWGASVLYNVLYRAKRV